MSRSRSKVAAVASAGVLAVGAAVGIASYAAADPSASPSAPSSSAGGSTGTGTDRPGRDGGHRGGPGRGLLGHEAAATLAEKLGLDEAKVQTALDEVRSTLPKPTQGEKPDPAAQETALVKALADKLGVAEDDVRKAVDEIQADRAAERAAGLKTRLDDAVKAGTLTQAEADAVTKAVEKGVIGGR